MAALSSSPTRVHTRKKVGIASDSLGSKLGVESRRVNPLELGYEGKDNNGRSCTDTGCGLLEVEEASCQEEADRVRAAKGDDRKRAVSLALVAALRKGGLDYQADEIQNCGTSFITYYCGSCGTMFGLPITCKQRLCPRCGAARAEDIWQRHRDKLAKANKPKHLSLTFKSVDGISAEYIRWAFGCWNRLWHRNFFQRAVFGALVSLEFTRGPKGWHPHVHCFIDADYVPKADIEAAWLEITGGSYVCRIRKVYGSWRKGVREVVKYPCKVVTFYQDPDLLKEFVEATEAVHLVRGYGSFYRIRQRHHLKRAQVECPACGQVDYLQKIGNHEPISKFVRVDWGWLFKPGGDIP